MRARFFALSYLLLSLSSCSVYLASQGRTAPDISAVKPGMERSHVETVLGNPVASLRKDTPLDVVSYQYFSEERPHYGRAAIYGVLDVATLGLAELVATPVEALQGDKYIVEILYDKHRRVEEMNVYMLKAPIEKPETMLGLNDARDPAPNRHAPAGEIRASMVAMPVSVPANAPALAPTRPLSRAPRTSPALGETPVAARREPLREPSALQEKPVRAESNRDEFVPF